jgi:chromosome segregation ATPase
MKKGSNQMTRNKVIFVCMIALAFSLVLTGCCSRLEFTRTKAQLAGAEAELEATRSERNRLQARVEELELAQGQASEGADAPGRLQQQVNQFILIREALQKREDELTQLRQVALDEAQAAKALMDTLATQLQAETDKVSELQNQLRQAQQAITELQNKFK